MSTVIQLYKDKERRIKAYPRSLASETYMSDKVTNVEEAIKPASGTSVERPIVTTVGKMFYDTTLNKPIWFNGSIWKDAAGTEV